MHEENGSNGAQMEKLAELEVQTCYAAEVPSNRGADELWEIWFLLEDLALRWAVEKAHRQLVEELKENITTTETAITEGNVRNLMETDNEFHAIITRLSGGRRLCRLCRTLRQNIFRYRINSIHAIDVAVRILKGHNAILKAIQDKKQEDHISQTLRTHLRQSKADIYRHGLCKHSSLIIGNGDNKRSQLKISI